MEMRKVTELKLWEKNPRKIKDEDFERLKKQIQKLGQYKPLIITPDNEVIGGNMRLKAYKELGIDEVWVSVVKPKDETEKLEYALSDNDRAGYYDTELLVNLMPSYNIDWKDYSVDILEPVDIEDIVGRLTQPTDEDWAEQFDKDSNSRAVDGLQQITFVLTSENLNKLKAKLKEYGNNKNEAIMLLIKK